MIRLGRINGFSASELNKFLDAFELCKKVMATDAFKSAVENSAYTGTGAGGPFIYTQLMGADRTLHFSIETPKWYKRWLTKEIAREVTGVGVILNRDKFQGLDLPSLCNTISHEFSHTCGFTHTFWDSPLRNNSVPYTIGRIVEALARSTPKLNEVSEHLSSVESTNS